MDVLAIQKALEAQGYNPGMADGIWGRKTSAAVRKFQEDKGLSATGLVDHATEKAIFSKVAKLADTSALVWMAEARRLMNTREIVGRGNNRVILDWAKNLEIDYDSDDIPWCGLFVAHCVGATIPNEPLPNNPLGARNWKMFGTKVSPMLGSILVFWRGSPSGYKGHVGFYDAEDNDAYYVLGGNQSDSVNIARVAKQRLISARWPKSAKDLNGAVIVRNGTDDFSVDEA